MTNKILIHSPYQCCERHCSICVVALARPPSLSASRSSPSFTPEGRRTDRVDVMGGISPSALQWWCNSASASQRETGEGLSDDTYRVRQPEALTRMCTEWHDMLLQLGLWRHHQECFWYYKHTTMYLEARGRDWKDVRLLTVIDFLAKQNKTLNRTFRSQRWKPFNMTTDRVNRDEDYSDKFRLMFETDLHWSVYNLLSVL